MKSADLKKLIIRSLERESDPEEIAGKIKNAGIDYSFREGFTDKVLNRIYSSGNAVIKKVEFVTSVNRVFYRIALTGVAAIVILMISIFVMEGSFSLNSFLGLGGNYDETILCLLTGN